jgi:hypothetical protein
MDVIGMYLERFTEDASKPEPFFVINSEGMNIRLGNGSLIARTEGSPYDLILDAIIENNRRTNGAREVILDHLTRLRPQGPFHIRIRDKHVHGLELFEREATRRKKKKRQRISNYVFKPTDRNIPHITYQLKYGLARKKGEVKWYGEERSNLYESPMYVDVARLRRGRFCREYN